MKTGKLKVAFCSIWHTRGISIHTKQLSDALENYGISTYICARWESDKFSNNGTIHHPRVTNFGDNPSGEDVADWLVRNEIKVFIQMEVHPNDWKRLEIIKSRGIKVVIYENLDILRLDSLERYKRYDHFLCNTFYNNTVFNELFPSSHRLVLPWGIPPDAVIKHKVSRHKDSPLVFVHVAGWGGINNRKNTDLVIKAFSEIPKNKAILRLYSQNPISHFGEEYEQLIQQSKSIIPTVGTIKNIMEVYVGADVLLWPSKREGVGLPIIEALSSGLSVIASDGYMMKQWLINNKHGIICPAKASQGKMYLPEMSVNLDDLRNCIEKILNRDLLSELKKNISNDANIWHWDWQSQIFADWVQSINSGNVDKKFSNIENYLPRRYIQFEEDRLRACQTI